MGKCFSLLLERKHCGDDLESAVMKVKAGYTVSNRNELGT
jgi:hypothetical protein